MVDIFDEIIEDKKSRDLFSIILKEKNDVFSKTNEELTPAIRSYVKASIPAQIPSLEEKQVAKLIKEAISRIPQVKPAKEVIREIKTVPQKIEPDKRIDDLLKELNELKDLFDKFKQILPMMGGSGVIGLPNPAGQGGLFVTTDGSKIYWGAGGSGSSGSSGTLVIGPDNTEGSWRFNISGSDLIVERYESGSWVEKSAFLATI